MRCNWGRSIRNDFPEIEPIKESDLYKINSVDVFPSAGFKTWFDVVKDGELIGFVTTRASGQLFRKHKTGDWFFAAGKWNDREPPHGRAILALLNYTSSR